MKFSFFHLMPYIGHSEQKEDWPVSNKSFDPKLGKELIETYGVKIDPALHKEILDRNAQFNSAPYGGFVNPVLVPQYDDSGEILDVQVRLPNSFAEQMLQYSATYNRLSATN